MFFNYMLYCISDYVQDFRTQEKVGWCTILFISLGIAYSVIKEAINKIKEQVNVCKQKYAKNKKATQNLNQDSVRVDKRIAEKLRILELMKQ